MGKIIQNGITYSGGSSDSAVNIKYNNSSSGISSTNVQGAIDKIANQLNGYSVMVLSETEYANLGSYDASTIYLCYQE